MGRVGLEVGSRWCYKQMLEFCLLLMHLSERLWLSPPIFTWGSNKRQKGSYIWISFGRPMYVFLQNTFLNKISIGISLVWVVRFPPIKFHPWNMNADHGTEARENNWFCYWEGGSMSWKREWKGEMRQLCGRRERCAIGTDLPDTL